MSKILLTGATGYVGGRLLRRFKERGFSCSCLVRHPEHLVARMGHDTKILKGDLSDPKSLDIALKDIDTAYYLVHSMASYGDFAQEEYQQAKNFAAAARKNKVRRIIYLGGLGSSDKKLSAHLDSRHRVGETLKESGSQVIEFRASIVIGPGSLSFEMIRGIVERLPIILAPKWVSVKAQPIFIEDLLEYLVRGLELSLPGNYIFEIGGCDTVSYGDLMREYAFQRGLRRIMISIPLLTPRLSSYWLGLVTPLYARVGKKLLESIQHPTIVENRSASRLFKHKCVGMKEAMMRSLITEEEELIESRWSDSVSSSGRRLSYGGSFFGTRIVESHSTLISKAPDKVFPFVRKIGGKNGWYFGNWLWKIRGYLDMVVGGVGMRRGRPHPTKLREGDTLDCWRVEKLVDNELIRLVAEMRLPGRAWLEFEVKGLGESSMVTMTAIFDPIGVLGQLYWYVLYPLHRIVFKGMLRGLSKAVYNQAN